MNKNKTILLITIIALIIVIIIGIIIFSINKENKIAINNEQNEKTKTAQLCEKISNSKEINFTQTLDNNNKIFITIKGDNGYKEVVKNGRTRKYITNGNDTYYLDEIDKNYYVYKNNDIVLTEIKEQFEKLEDITEISKGKEKINGKKFDYEEISGYQGFLFNNELSVNDLEYAKTRLYYDDEKLVYIKTIVGESEEIIKVDISYNNINDSYFNIPKDFLNKIE